MSGTDLSTYTKVTSLSGTPATRPDFFEVRTKNGLIQFYGLSLDTPGVDTIGAVRTSWWLTRTEDRFYNSVDYVYEAPTATSANGTPYVAERRLKAIEYGGNVELAPTHRIVLGYESRPDQTAPDLARSMSPNISDDPDNSGRRSPTAGDIHSPRTPQAVTQSE